MASRRWFLAALHSLRTPERATGAGTSEESSGMARSMEQVAGSWGSSMGGASMAQLGQTAIARTIVAPQAESCRPVGGGIGTMAPGGDEKRVPAHEVASLGGRLASAFRSLG